MPFEGILEKIEENQDYRSMKKRQVVVKKNGSSRTSSASLARTVRYAECQKNHAANIGGYAVDGCREFMASGEEGTTDAHICAACGCHRNFHRREVESEVVFKPYNIIRPWFGVLDIARNQTTE
ncbi:hypothetical protein F0562_023438 [Nyssa sinensis]|uniref:ZF-HD dimerization-type domain-containing protein n=1 Tax=Nyssa sinensis TaxID=561372 RepID=A0A5J5BIE9_9ASTE|nr:hypothetical protein F0562_023438 [Nyssa sinensis]